MSMSRTLAILFAVAVLLPSFGLSQPAKGPERIGAPKLEAVAETQLLMEGIAQPNLRGLEKMLKGKAPDAEGWVFARGQALLIGETGNLLLMRPPKNQGRDAWMSRAVELRESATKLARFAAAKDLLHCRESLVEMAGSCNRCHETFRVATRIRVFGPEEP
jgi:cytochrome c556